MAMESAPALKALPDAEMGAPRTAISPRGPIARWLEPPTVNTRSDSCHVRPRSALIACATPAPSFQIAWATPSGATSIQGRSSKRVLDSSCHVQVAPVS